MARLATIAVQRSVYTTDAWFGTAYELIPPKYQWVEHAERNAIFQAASLGISIKGSTLYSTLFPCTDCARAIIQSGIKEVITYYYKDTNRYSSWDDWQVSLEMLEEAWVGIHLLVKEGV